MEDNKQIKSAEEKLQQAIEWCDEKLKEYDSKSEKGKALSTRTYFSGKANATNDVRLYLLSLQSEVKPDGKEEWLSLFNQFVLFALSTFKDASPLSSLEKLDEEIKEVANEIQHGHEDLAEEYADCMMCILDSAARANIYPADLQGAFAKKLKINQDRTWVRNSNNTYSHTRKNNQQ